MKQLKRQLIEQFAKIDFECEEELQQTIKLAARLFCCPSAAISVLDRQTQWLKVKVGIASDQIARYMSLCFHTLKRKSPLIIPDTHQDPRFVCHLSVTDAPFVRFYAATPLITRTGHKIGTLCVSDTQPHEVSREQRLMLKVLGRHAMSMMELTMNLTALQTTAVELKKERQNLAQSNLRLRAMFESMKDPYWLLGEKGEILDFNLAAQSLEKNLAGRALCRGQLIEQYLTASYKPIFMAHYLAALKGERSELERSEDIESQGTHWWHCQFEPVRGGTGKIIGVAYLEHNITERKQQEQLILERNAQLLRIAQIQAHDYRGPVASIIGVMNLIEADGYVASREELRMLQSAVTNLDEKIREVVDLAGSSMLAATSG